MTSIGCWRPLAKAALALAADPGRLGAGMDAVAMQQHHRFGGRVAERGTADDLFARRGAVAEHFAPLQPVG